MMFVQGAIPEHILQANADNANGASGATTVFIGKVREDIHDGKKVVCIEFTAQKTIAVNMAKTILEESKKHFGIHKAEIWHSLGRVNTGEACFYVRVIGKHRQECFNALSHIVDEIKSRCPIFGREIFPDGDYQWKENKK